MTNDEPRPENFDDRLRQALGILIDATNRVCELLDENLQQRPRRLDVDRTIAAVAAQMRTANVGQLEDPTRDGPLTDRDARIGCGAAVFLLHAAGMTVDDMSARWPVRIPSGVLEVQRQSVVDLLRNGTPFDRSRVADLLAKSAGSLDRPDLLPQIEEAATRGAN